MSVADQLRGAREYLGLPLDYIAGESGIEASVIKAFETGEREPTDLELRRVGRVLGYPLAYFRGQTSSLEPEELEAVARWAEELDENDRRQALRFAEYLLFAALSEADAGS
jgi:transcriptional regulator with XRE-family HTH domain